MYEQFNKETASTEDRIAWALCQIIDDDAPMRWTRYRFAAGCIAKNAEVMSDLQKLAAQVAQPLTELLAAAGDVCKTLEHPTHSVNAIQMWRLRDALAAHGIGKDQA